MGAYGFDYVFIDCPPSLGLLTVNAMVAAREVLIPIQCEYYALEGVGQLLRNIELVQSHLNRSAYRVDCAADDVRRAHEAGRSGVRRRCAATGDKVLRAVVPRSVKVSEAPDTG